MNLPTHALVLAMVLVKEAPMGLTILKAEPTVGSFLIGMGMLLATGLLAYFFGDE